MLADYNDVLPGLANRIVTMAESDQTHAQSMDRRDSLLRFTGQFSALAIALAGLVIGAILISGGHSVAGLATLLTALAPIVGAFLYRQVTASKSTDNDGSLSA